MKKQIVPMVLGLTLGLGFMVPANAENAIQKMEQFFSRVNSMTADFSQTVKSQNRPEPEESGGVLQMQRPGKFRWNYNKPYEQQIVADGSKLWVYDVEMEQVLVKSEDLALGNTPAVLLSGDATITDKFNVTEITPDASGDKSMAWVQLVPKQKETGFEKLLLGFAGDNLKSMELKDAFGQLTRITFSHLVLNKAIDPSVFVFKVPAGVDVIDESQAKE